MGARDQDRRRDQDRCRPGSPIPRYGHFANERRLSAREIETINAWVDAGAPAGNPSDAPPPLVFENGWNIKPDVIVEMPKPFELPAHGTINYKYVRREERTSRKTCG